MSKGFGIGALSKRTGVNIETIRYYEKIGLLPPPLRTEGGHRVYSGEQMKRLFFVRRSRELGFALEDIRSLLGLAEGGNACGEIRETALAHLAGVRRKIADLRRMERTLAETTARCKGGTSTHCPIVEALSENSRAGHFD